ncbi:hypothetical protein BTTAP_110005 [Brochothrix thermosphacta]|nr:hypothetical protein BTH160X_140083 [Brochothrix thermosphacta]SPP26945.1 hypothetical protein BTTAP_110005 [Brochothrix thermosphacta]
MSYFFPVIGRHTSIYNRMITLTRLFVNTILKECFVFCHILSIA